MAAFNPFHKFRKHQKTIFSILVIICMFVFILQFGAGDAFTRALNWFGGGRGRGSLVTTLNGTKVYERDLTQLSRQRQIAVGFFEAASRVAFSDSSSKVDQQLRLQMAFQWFSKLRQYGLPPGGTRPENILDFMLWRQQAERLGITLTETDVRAAVNRMVGADVFGGKPFTSSLLAQALVRSDTKSNQRSTPQDLLTAVTDELLVLMAQEAILGPAPQVAGLGSAGPDAPPIPVVTPGEFLKYYREQRTTLNVWMLPVKVEAFVASAKEKKTPPSDEVLKKLFDDYKNAVPDPTRALPAFKEPERVKVEWVRVTPELPYFKEAARRKIELPPYLATLGLAMSGFAGLNAPGAACPWTALAGAPVSFDRTLPRYMEYAENQSKPVLTAISTSKPYPHDRYFTHPAPLNFIVGALAAGANRAPGAGALPALATAWASAAGATEIEEWRRLLSLQLSLQGYTICPPLSGGVIVPPLGLFAYRPKVNEYRDVRERLLTEIKNDELKNPDGVISTEMDTFAKELAKLKGKPDDARKLIDDTLKKFGLEGENHVEMPTVLDSFQLEAKDMKNKELKALREAYNEKQSNPRELKRLPEKFVTFLMSERAPSTSPGAEEGLTSPYDPKGFKSKDDQYLVWQKEHLLTREPKFAEVRDKVLEEWYRQEARKLAREKAGEWSTQARKDGSLAVSKPRLIDDARKVLKLDEKSDVGFTLSGVARLVNLTAQEGLGGRSYSDYKAPDDMPYARPDLADQLVKQLKNPGDSIVVSDKPEKVYYVAVLDTRDDQTNLAGFEDVLSKTPIGDQLWNHMMRAKREEQLRLVVKQLRIDAGAKLKEDGDYDLPPDIRTRSTDSSEGD